MIPSASENPNGLHQRYTVTKADGSTDPNAVYFVLRLDGAGDDKQHIEACRAAAMAYADYCSAHKVPHLETMARELEDLVDRLVGAEAGKKYLNEYRQSHALKHGSEPMTNNEIAHAGACSLREVSEAMDHGRGPIRGLPEPRVIHQICQVLGAKYEIALIAFGHTADRRGNTLRTMRREAAKSCLYLPVSAFRHDREINPESLHYPRPLIDHRIEFSEVSER